MLKRLVVPVCALALLVSCVPPEESNDRIKAYDPEENVMGQIQERGVLRIGVPSDYPPFAIVDGAAIEGFVVELGTLAAEALGVEAQFIPAPNRVLLDLVDIGAYREDTDADLVFPMVGITEELVKRYTFTDPYWVGHTRELRFPAGPTNRVGLLPTGPDVELLREAYATPGAKVAGEENSTEGYGAAVRTGAATLATLVSQVFNEADAEGDWSRFYEEWLADYFAEPTPENVPIMTVEDAAALYPSDLER